MCSCAAWSGVKLTAECENGWSAVIVVVVFDCAGEQGAALVAAVLDCANGLGAELVVAVGDWEKGLGVELGVAVVDWAKGLGAELGVAVVSWPKGFGTELICVKGLGVELVVIVFDWANLVGAELCMVAFDCVIVLGLNSEAGVLGGIKVLDAALVGIFDCASGLCTILRLPVSGPTGSIRCGNVPVGDPVMLEFRL